MENANLVPKSINNLDKNLPMSLESQSLTIIFGMLNHFTICFMNGLSVSIVVKFDNAPLNVAYLEKWSITTIIVPQPLDFDRVRMKSIEAFLNGLSRMER